MTRPIKLACASALVLVTSAFAAACGTQKISVPTSNTIAHRGAVLFAQRCSGCHTLSYAATNGSASNVRTAMQNNGPNFNVRCERPVTRVLYAIENGGFSGAIMPQNVVVGADARAVAEFVSEYAGRQSPHIIGATPCASQQVGTLPPPGQATTSSTTTASSSSTSQSSSSTTAAGRPAAKRHKRKK